MNAPVLILPALAATMALSAAKTLPADLRHDTKEKAPLTVSKMAIARGAGSTCRLGCNEPNVPCHSIYGTDYVIVGHQKQIWHSHLECGFSSGSDTCTPLPDAPCNEVYDYSASDTTCAGRAHVDFTTSSTCTL